MAQAISSLLLVTLCGCAQMPKVQLPMSGPRLDPNLTLYDNHFKGAPAGKSLIAPTTPFSSTLQRQAIGVVPDPALDSYLNSVLARLQKGLPGEPVPARVYISPDTAFTATSYEDGGIYIPYKVLGTLQSEDELAALIGHEYSHVVLHHYSTNWVNTAANLTYSAANIAINKKVGKATDTNLLGMAAANEATLGVSQVGIMPALTRDQENNADRLGVDLLIKAGYSFTGDLDLLSRMQDWDARNEAIAQQRKINYINLFSASDKSLLAKTIDGKIDTFEQQIGDFIRTTSLHHEQGEDRATLLRTYLKQHYRGVERPPVNTAAYAKVMGTAHAASLFGGVDDAYLSSLALQTNKPRDALSYAQKASRSAASQAPFVKHVLINALAANGKGAEARELLERGISQRDTLFVDNKLMLDVLKRNSPEKALLLAQESYDQFGEFPELYPDLISLNKKMKNPIAVMKFYGLCAGTSMSTSNNALLASCSKANKE
jgi:hypothetical protein